MQEGMMTEPSNEGAPPKTVSGTLSHAVAAAVKSSEVTVEGVDLPFGLKHPLVRRFYQWLTDLYVRNTALSVFVFVVSLLIGTVAVPLLAPGIPGLAVGFVVSLLLALVSPVAVVIKRNTYYL